MGHALTPFSNCSARSSSAKMWNLIFFMLKSSADFTMLSVSSRRFPQATTARCMTSSACVTFDPDRPTSLFCLEVKKKKKNLNSSQLIQTVTSTTKTSGRNQLGQTMRWHTGEIFLMLHTPLAHREPHLNDSRVNNAESVRPACK